LQRSRSTSRVADLEKQIARPTCKAFTGIAHTRWATHGAPASHNAHPHFSPGELARIALVHNGIIENHDELRAELTALGYVFQSQTDTEVIAHLVDHMYDGDLFAPSSRPSSACTAPTPSPCSAATSRTAWSARARARR
jgi:glucosamine--fructose-6-phosphate aminotransferase (isomerizing)